MQAAPKKFKVVGISDDQDVCECCGRKNLKRIVHLEDTETGHTVAYGVVCAAKAQKITVHQQEIAVRDFERAQIKAAKKELFPFELRRMNALDAAPNDFNDPNHYQKRRDFLDNDKRVIEYRQKKQEIASKYKVDSFRLG